MSVDIYFSAAADDVAMVRNLTPAIERLGLTVGPPGLAGAAQTAELVVVFWSAAAAADVRVPLEMPLAAYRSALLLVRLDDTPVAPELRRFALDLRGIDGTQLRLAAIVERIGDALDLPNTAVAFGDPVDETAAASAPPHVDAELAMAEDDRLATRDPAMFVIRPAADEDKGPAASSAVTMALIAAALGALFSSVVAWKLLEFDRGVTRIGELLLNLAYFRVAPFVGAFAATWMTLRLVPARYGRKRILRILAIGLLALITITVVAVMIGLVGTWIAKQFDLTVALESEPYVLGASIFVGGASAAILFLPIAYGVCRLFGAILPRAWVAKAACLVAAGILGLALLPSIDAIDRLGGTIDEKVAKELARVGWRVGSDKGLELADRIRAFQTANGLKPTGVADRALLDALRQQPDKRHWKVRLDGTGDTRSITDALNRRGLDAEVDVGPGVFRECIGVSYTEHTLILRGAGPSTVILCNGEKAIAGQTDPAPNPGKDVFAAAAAEVDKAQSDGTDTSVEPYLTEIVSLDAGDRLERLTIRQTSMKVDGTLVAMNCARATDGAGLDCADTPPVLSDVTIENAGKGWAVQISGDIRAGRNTAVVRSARIRGGIFVNDDTNPLIERTTFTGAGLRAIHLGTSQAVIRDSEFTTGAGLYASGPGATISDSRFAGAASGAAIEVAEKGDLAVTRVAFTGFRGDATPVWVYGEGKVKIVESTFSSVVDRAILLDQGADADISASRFFAVGQAAISLSGRAKARIRRNRFAALDKGAVWAGDASSGLIAENDVQQATGGNVYIVALGDASRFAVSGNRINTPNRPCIGILARAQVAISGNILTACGDGIAIDRSRAALVNIGDNRLPADGEVRFRDP